MQLQEFRQVMNLLAAVHGENHAVFTNPDITAIWFEFFASKITAERFKQIMKYYLGHCHWMPKAPNDIYKAWIESGEQRPPGEDFIGIQGQITASLPSSEAQEQARIKQELEQMTSEQMLENKRRMAELVAGLAERKKMNREPVKFKPDYTAIARDLAKAWEMGNK